MFLPENENENVVVEDNTNDYIDQIKKLKESSVSKDDYNKLKADNKKLIDALANGTQMDVVESKTSTADKINELRSKLFSKRSNLNNLEYCDTALQLREALIENGDRDPFLPFGHNVIATESDIETANRVANVMKDCIEYADGDSDIFTNELQRRTVDISIPKKK